MVHFRVDVLNQVCTSIGSREKLVRALGVGPTLKRAKTANVMDAEAEAEKQALGAGPLHCMIIVGLHTVYTPQDGLDFCSCR